MLNVDNIILLWRVVIPNLLYIVVLLSCLIRISKLDFFF